MTLGWNKCSRIQSPFLFQHLGLSFKFMLKCDAGPTGLNTQRVFHMSLRQMLKNRAQVGLGGKRGLVQI